MRTLAGTYQFPASSAECSAELVQAADRSIRIYQSADGQLLWHGTEYQSGVILPGLATPIRLGNGGCFLPAQPDAQLAGRQWTGLAAKLEANALAIAASVVAIPVVLWWTLNVGLPALASTALPYFPPTVLQQIDQQTLYTLDKTLLDPSTLSKAQQVELNQQWLAELAKLPDPIQPNIQFRHAPKIGANAFALPGGTIVITDELLQRLEKSPDAVLAVLLHELGHVQHQHGLQLMVQATATTVLVAMLFNDLETMSEAVLGTGSSLLQAAFSRDMETAADQFATASLIQLQKSPQAFADALALLTQQDKTSEINDWTQYFQSHPQTAERINKAKAQAKPNPE